jgi:hypothetical protein
VEPADIRAAWARGHEEGAASARAKIDEWREIAQKAQAALLTFEDALGVRLGEGLAATGLGLRQRLEVHQYWTGYIHIGCPNTSDCLALRVDTSTFAQTSFDPNGTWLHPWNTQYYGETTVRGTEVPGRSTIKTLWQNMQHQDTPTTWAPTPCDLVLQRRPSPLAYRETQLHLHGGMDRGALLTGAKARAEPATRGNPWRPGERRCTRRALTERVWDRWQGQDTTAAGR